MMPSGIVGREAQASPAPYYRRGDVQHNAKTVSRGREMCSVLSASFPPAPYAPSIITPSR